jgi:hypothetical protein
MLSFVVLAKENLGANPVIVGFNKHRFISHLEMHRRFKSHSKDSEQSISESVNQPLQRHHTVTKGSDLYAHVELGAKEQ